MKKSYLCSASAADLFDSLSHAFWMYSEDNSYLNLELNETEEVKLMDAIAQSLRLIDTDLHPLVKNILLLVIKEPSLRVNNCYQEDIFFDVLLSND